MFLFPPENSSLLFEAAVPQQPVEGWDHFHIHVEAGLPLGLGTCFPS